MNTNCEKCLFLKQSGCEFGIDQIIADKVSKTKNGQIINDYRCNYGFGKQTYEENQYITTYEEIKSNIENKNALNYLLYIDYSDFDFDYDSVVNFISNLQFLPTAFIMAIKSDLSQDLLDKFNQRCAIPWRFSKKTQETSKYYAFVGSISHYLNTNPDVLYLMDLDNHINEYVNEVHIKLKIKHENPIDIITFESTNNSIYITKECFFENRHNWQDIMNDLSNYIQKSK